VPDRRFLESPSPLYQPSAAAARKQSWASSLLEEEGRGVSKGEEEVLAWKGGRAPHGKEAGTGKIGGREGGAQEGGRRWEGGAQEGGRDARRRARRSVGAGAAQKHTLLA
jgi:hypothetical protein